MNQHIDTSKVKHDILLLTSVKELKANSQQKDLEIEELKKKNNEKDTRYNGLKQDFEDLKNEFNQLTTNIENSKKQTKICFDEIKQNQTHQSNKIDNLETFADRSSKIHFTLSESKVQRNYRYSSTLLQQNYDVDKDVKEWNKIVEEVNKDDNKCLYLEILKHSVNRYKETIYLSLIHI